MNRTTAHSRMQDLMDENGLTGWTFTWIKAKTTLGLCNHTKRELSLSTHLVDNNEWPEVRKVVVHEIAHALAGPNHGHDRHWRIICLTLGGDGKRCSAAATVAPTWVATCPGCKRTTGQHRAPLRVKACGSCTANVWRFDRILVWSHKGSPVAHNKISKRYADEHLLLTIKYGKVKL